MSPKLIFGMETRIFILDSYFERISTPKHVDCFGLEGKFGPAQRFFSTEHPPTRRKVNLNSYH